MENPHLFDRKQKNVIPEAPKEWFPKQFAVGFSLRKKGWPRYALAAPPEFVRHVSASCPPSVRFGRASEPCPPYISGACPPRVRPVHLESAMAAPPNFVRQCPPWVRLGRASKPYPPCVRLLSALRPPWARDGHVFKFVVSGVCPPLCLPWVRCGRASELCLPCVCLVSTLCPPCVHLEPALKLHFQTFMSRSCFPALCPLWFRLQTLSAMCPPCILSTMCHVSAKTLALSLDCARSWPAVGQGRGISRQNSFALLRNPQRLYIARPLGSFLHIFFLAHQTRPSLAHPMLEKLFGVYVGIIICSLGALRSLKVYVLPSGYLDALGLNPAGIRWLWGTLICPARTRSTADAASRGIENSRQS